ncbi:hypothetical protein Q7P36_004070 [Cladosporium allicinum]
MEPGSPSLVQRDEQGFFRQSSYANHRPKLSASMSAPHVDEYSSPVSEHSTSNPWKSTAPLPHATLPQSPPYDAPAYGRAAYDERTYSKPPSARPRASRHNLISLKLHQHLLIANLGLSGLLQPRRQSALQQKPFLSQAKPRARENRSSHPQSKEDQAGLGKRFKSAFRDIFKKDPIDESQFERISDRHWTDEY